MGPGLTLIYKFFIILWGISEIVKLGFRLSRPFSVIFHPPSYFNLLTKVPHLKLVMINKKIVSHIIEGVVWIADRKSMQICHHTRTSQGRPIHVGRREKERERDDILRLLPTTSVPPALKATSSFCGRLPATELPTFSQKRRSPPPPLATAWRRTARGGWKKPWRGTGSTGMFSYRAARRNILH